MDLTKIKGIFRLRHLINYETDHVNTVVVEKNDRMMFLLKAFDAGQSLPTHTAPGNAVLTVLEGSVTIMYGDTQYDLGEGENFVLVKGMPHSVFASSRAKISLVVALDPVQ